LAYATAGCVSAALLFEKLQRASFLNVRRERFGGEALGNPAFHLLPFTVLESDARTRLVKGASRRGRAKRVGVDFSASCEVHRPFLDRTQRLLIEGPAHGCRQSRLEWEDRSVPHISSLEADVAKLIVQTLTLKVDPAQIQPEEPLFGDGLGLDSIDALELALMVSQQYGYQIRSDDPDTVATFASLRSLCQSIEKHRTK
jgi:acyl carrier protein